MMTTSVRNRSGFTRTGIGWMAVAAILALLPGCDSTTFTPPRPAELTRTPGAAVGRAPTPAAAPSADSSASKAPLPSSSIPRSRMVELLLNRPPSADRQYLAQFMRRDCSVKRAPFRLKAPEKEPLTAAQLAEEIRASSGRSIGALVVEAIDAPEVRQALQEAQSKGVKIILLDKPLASPSAGEKYPYVVLTGFEESAKKLIATLIEDTKLFKHPADAPVLVLLSEQKDFYSEQRVNALVEALKGAGRKFEVFPFPGDQESARKIVADYVKSHPDLAMALGDDEFSLAGACQSMDDWVAKKHRWFAVGGFAACDARLNDVVLKIAHAVVNRNTEGFARKLVGLAVDLMDQKAVPERNELEQPIFRNAPDPVDVAAAERAAETASEPAGQPTPSEPAPPNPKSAEKPGDKKP